MTDIVELLRKAQADGFYGHIGAEDAGKAADAIERLSLADEWCRMTIAERDDEIVRLRAELELANSPVNNPGNLPTW